MSWDTISGVRDATRDVYDSAVGRVNQTKLEIEGAGMSVISTIKSNPIPTAMVGMGLYWLYQSMQENEQRGSGGRYDARPYVDRAFLPG